MRNFRKEKNMRANPQVTLLCFDPRRPLRSLEVRGIVVEMTEIGAMEHLDGLSLLYTGQAPYFGACVPAELRQTEFPVLCKIEPRHVVALNAEPVEGGRPMSTAIPASHLDLLTRPVHGVLTTRMPDGQPQSTLVWCDYDGECACVNTTLERQKGRNLLADQRATLLLVDPDDTSRYLELRGEVELVQEGALAHLDALTRKYTRHPQFYGYVYPCDQRDRETRVRCRLHAQKITVDAIHR